MDMITNKLEEKAIKDEISHMTQLTKSLVQDIRTCKLLIDQHKKFGMSDELSDLVSPDIQISEEGLLDKLKSLGKNLSGAIKKRWDKIKEKLIKRQEVKEDSMNKMIRTIEELEASLIKNNYTFDENKLGMSISAKDLIKRFEAALSLEKLLQNKSLIKKNSDKLMWWDLSSVIPKLREFSIYVISRPASHGIIDFTYDKKKAEENERFYKKPEYTKTAKELGWDATSLKKTISLVKTAYDILYIKAVVANMCIEIAANNDKVCNDVCQEFGEESDEFAYIVHDLSFVAWRSADVVEHLLINLDLTFENFTRELSHTFMSHDKQLR